MWVAWRDPLYASESGNSPDALKKKKKSYLVSSFPCYTLIASGRQFKLLKLA
jgi:hypothetical protein